MLQSIHDKAKGILGIIIVIFLGLVFTLWGVGDYLTGATEKFAAKVGDIQISQSEFDQGLAKQRQRLEQAFKGDVPKSPLFEQQLKDQVLEQLITQRVLQKMVDDEGYRVSDQVLAQKIKSMEAFQQAGVFAVDVYHDRLQSQGMAVKEFENLFRNDLAVQQLQDAVMRSSVIGPNELNILNRIQNQTRDVNYLLFNDGQFTSGIDVSAEEISAYFDDNQNAYMYPETVTVSFVELKPSSIADAVPLDEKAVKRLYDDYVTSLASKEQRKASHILIDVAADADQTILASKKLEADALIARINKGESFAALAKEYSKDPGSAAKGGNLGWISRGMMVPEFEQALFKLDKGVVSAAIKSSFGYHIIQLDDIKSVKPESFANKKAELTQQLQAQAIEDHFYEQSELMATKAYENDQSLQEVSNELGLEITTSSEFSRRQGEGIASNEKIRKAAFEPLVLSEGRNSEIIELGENHAVVLRINTHTESKPKALEDVKMQIVAMLKTQKAKQKSKAAALSALAKLESGEAVDSVKGKALLMKLGTIKRDNQTADPDVVRDAFMLPRPENNKPVYRMAELATGSAIIELTAVNLPAEASNEQLQVLVKQYQNEQATRDMTAVLNELKSKTDSVRAKAP